jgi:hypothetical protein
MRVLEAPDDTSDQPAMDAVTVSANGWTRRIAAHWGILTILAIGVAVRAVGLIAAHPALVFWGDTYYYLDNSESLDTDSFHPAGYSAFLRLASVTDSLVAVPVLQHAMMLGIATATYALLLHKGVRRWVAVLAVAPIALDGYQVIMGQFVLAESLAVTLSLGALLVAAVGGPPSVRRAVLVGLLLAAAVLTRSVLLAMVVPACIMMFRPGVRKRLVVPAMLVAMAAPLVAYGLVERAENGTFQLEQTSDLLLYARTATFADCSRMELSERAQMLCDPTPVGEREGANHYAFAPDSPLRSNFPSDGFAVPEDVTAEFSRAAIAAQPLDYAKSVIVDFFRYLRPVMSTGPRDQPLETWQYPEDIGTPDDPHVAYLGFSAEGHGTGLAPVTPSIDTDLTAAMRAYQRAVHVPPVLLGACLILGLGTVALIRRTTGQLREVTLLALATSTAGLLLMGASSTASVFDYRFLFPIVPVLWIGGALGLHCWLAVRRGQGTAAASQDQLVPSQSS